MERLERLLADLGPDRRTALRDWLGVGEVSIRLTDREIRETRLPGVWLDGDGIVVAPFPESVLIMLQVADTALPVTPLKAEAGNVAAVLEEILAASLAFRTVHKAGEAEMPARIDLSRLPLPRSDIALLEESLGHAGVQILVDCEGETQFTAARHPGIWWGRYYEPEGREMLVTIEIGEVPELVRASQEDIAAAEAELLDWLAGEMDPER